MTPPVHRVGELTADRLKLTPLDASALQSWLDGDAAGLFLRTGATFREPLETPPLFGEDLPTFRDRMMEAPDELGWWVWLVSRVDDGTAVGVCGLGGRPSEDGVVVLGYAVYPVFEGVGYATEACGRLLEWLFEQPEVWRVRATVPAWNAASVRVAEKLGIPRVGTAADPEVGEVIVFELEAP